MPSPADFFRQLQQSMPALEQEIKETIIAVEAENFHAKNFREEGFTDTSFNKWPDRKQPETPQRALLVKTSTMKGQALKGTTTPSGVEFVFSLDYMKVHNEGGRAGRGKGFQMAQRQYVGESEYLKNRFEQQARKFLDNYFKNI